MVEKLRRAIKEARQTNQSMIVIWATWKHWYDFKEFFSPKSGISQKEDNSLPEWTGIVSGTAIVVSVEQIASSDDFFNQIVNLCEELHYEGPITLLPGSKRVNSFKVQ